MSGFEVQSLRHFVEDGAKEPPPFFVGRDSIINDIFTKARRAMEKQRAPAGNTRVIQGAPGAGKSALLSQIERRCNANHEARVVKITNNLLENHLTDVLLAIKIAATAQKESWYAMFSKLGSAWGQRIGDVNAFGISADLSGLLNEAVPGDLMALKAQIPAKKFLFPVIVAIDEAQRLSPGKNTQHAQFLQMIHDADDISLPLTTVLAGLGDTKERVHSIGITYGLEAYSIGCLTWDEGQELMQGWNQYFGIELGACQDKVNLLIAPTDGWPRHLHWAQTALAEAALTVNGKLDLIQDWVCVFDKSNELRRGYYNWQYSDAMSDSNRLLAEIMLNIRKFEKKSQVVKRTTIIDWIEELRNQRSEAAWQLPNGFDAHDYITHLIHRGALQENYNPRSIACPIPSFQRFMIAEGGGDIQKWPEPSNAENGWKRMSSKLINKIHNV